MFANHKLLTDPTVAISLFALLIAIGTSIWTIFTNAEQNRRWDALNVGRVEISNIRFMMWKELSREEATSTDWGYKPILFSHAENGLHTGKYRVPYELFLADPNSMERIPGSNGFFTISEANAEMARLNIGTELKPTIWKKFQILVVFENKGATLASDMKCVVNMKEWGKDTWVEVFKSKQGVALAASTSCNIAIGFSIPLLTDFPKEIDFEIDLSYEDVHGELQNRKIPVRYDYSMNYWTHGIN